MPLALAERSELIAPSATLAMGAEARRLKAKGIAVLDFALGEPDFDTPKNIQEAAFKAIRYRPDPLYAACRDSRTSPSFGHPLHTSAPTGDRFWPGGDFQRRQAIDPQRPHGRLRAGR